MKNSTTSANIIEPAILIRLTKDNPPTLSPTQLEKLTSYCWRVGIRRNGAQYAFAIHKEIILQVYEIKKWHLVQNTSLMLPQDKGRYYFDAVIATNKSHYIGQSYHFKPHSSTPVIYKNC